MVKIKFTKDTTFCPDGITAINFKKGEELELGHGQAANAVRGEFAVMVHDKDTAAADKEEAEREAAEKLKEEEADTKKRKKLGLKPKGNKKAKGPDENK